MFFDRDLSGLRALRFFNSLLVTLYQCGFLFRVPESQLHAVLFYLRRRKQQRTSPQGVSTVCPATAAHTAEMFTGEPFSKQARRQSKRRSVVLDAQDDTSPEPPMPSDDFLSDLASDSSESSAGSNTVVFNQRSERTKTTHLLVLLTVTLQSSQEVRHHNL